MTSENPSKTVPQILSQVFARDLGSKGKEVLRDELLVLVLRAEQEFKQAQQINPNFSKSLRNLGLLRFYRRDISSVFP